MKRRGAPRQAALSVASDGTGTQHHRPVPRHEGFERDRVLTVDQMHQELHTG
jgi:hypothetical protein